MWLRIALIIAAVVCASLAAYAYCDRNIVETAVRGNLRDLKQRQQLPPEFVGVDVETVDLSEYAFEVPPAVLFRHNLAHFLAVSWYVWVPGVVLACVGITWLVSFLFKASE